MLSMRLFMYVRASFAIRRLWASCMETKKYRYVKLKSCIIREGTWRVARSFRVLSKPVESIKRLRDATQNQMRIVNIRNRIIPSAVIAKVMLPMFVVHRGFPVVKKSVGKEIRAINRGISVVRVKRCFKGMREATAKTMGTKHIISR